MMMRAEEIEENPREDQDPPRGDDAGNGFFLDQTMPAGGASSTMAAVMMSDLDYDEISFGDAGVGFGGGTGKDRSAISAMVEEAPEDRADGRAPPQAAAAIDSKTSTDLLDMIQEQAKEIERLRKMVEKKQ